MEEREKTIHTLEENNRDMEKILLSLKELKVDVVTLEKPLNYSFEDLISEMLLVFLPLEVSKFDM